MADNILKGIISITAPGVAQTTSQVSAAISKTEQSLKKIAPAGNQATLALSNLGRVAQDAPFGFIGIANNLNPLLESFQRLKVSTGSTGGALKALGQSLTGAGGIGFALSVASSLAIVFGDRLFGASKAAKEASTAADNLKKSIESVFSSVAKEATEVGSLVTILRSETETRERKLSTIKELQRIQPEIFNGLRLEGNAVIGLDAAYTAYLNNLKNVIAAKLIQVRLEQKIEQLLKLQGAAATQSEKRLLDATKKFTQSQRGIVDQDGRKLYEEFYAGIEKRSADTISTLEADIKGLFKDLQGFSNQIAVPGVVTPKVKSKVPKAEIEAEELDLTFLNVNLQGGFDKGVFKTLFGEGIQQNGAGDIIIPVRFLAAAKKGEPVQDDGYTKMMADFQQMEANLKSLAGVVQDTLGPVFQSFFNTIASGGNAFKAFAQAASQALIGLISKLATTALLSLIIGPLLGAGSAAGAASSKFGDVFKFLSGFGGFRAGGGPVQAGKAYVVGENRPELFVPNTSGRIIPNVPGFGAQGGAYRGGTMSDGLAGRVVFEIAGNKLRGVLTRANRSALGLE